MCSGPVMHITWEGCHTTCAGWAQQGRSRERVTGEGMEGMEEWGLEKKTLSYETLTELYVQHTAPRAP